MSGSTTLKRFRRAGLALGALWITFGAGAASGANYPDRPIHLVVGFPAGGASDVAARAIGQKMAQQMGKAVIVDNRPGAGSNIGSSFVARAPADGYTILLGTISLSINPTLYRNLTYDPLRDFAPVSLLASAPFLLVVNTSSPYKSVADLVSAAKTRNGAPDLSYASAGNGSGAHVFTELFASTSGIHLTHVPYKGAAPAMTDVLGNQVPITFDNIITTLPLVKAGKLRALAVSTNRRSEIAPDIPTLAEAGVAGFDATAWFGFFVPAGTPNDVIARLSAEAAEALKDPTVRARLLAIGAEPVGSTPEAFNKFFHSEVKKWGKVVRDAKIQID